MARDAERTFLADGPQAVREALRRSGCVLQVFATDDATTRHHELYQLAVDAALPWQLVDQQAMTRLSETVTPQGLVAVCRFLDGSLDAALSAAASSEHSVPLVAVAADIRDPGNAGTLIRCADAVDATAVVLAGSAVDPYNGKAVRASAGSLFHLPVIRGTAVHAAVDAVRSGGCVVLAAAGTGSVSLDEAIDSSLLESPTAWLFGNEAGGLPTDLTELADHVVRIPIYGRAESLNVATAAAVCLYASARAQGR